MAEEVTNGSEEIVVEEREKVKKGSRIKLIVIMVVALIVLGGGGFFAYTTFFAKKDNPEVTDEAKPKKVDKTVIFSLDPFLVNLATIGRYLKVTMQLELRDVSYEEVLKSKMPKTRDIIITLLSGKTLETVSGPEGKLLLKDEILLRLNKVLGEGEDPIKNIYFTQFIMQ